MTTETRATQLLNDSVNFQIMDRVVHRGGTVLAPETLVEVKEKLAAKTFNIADYPQLSLAQSGQPHYRQLEDSAGNITGEWFKFMCLDLEDLCHLKDPMIVDLLEKLADHVRGEYDGEEWLRGFERYAGLMTGNRDGVLTAFTTGITLLDSYMTSPVAHSTLYKNDNQEFMDWLQTFHSTLGDLGGKVMRAVMSKAYLQFADERHEYYNPPLFGSSTGAQLFFTSSQINRSRPSLSLGGTAGGVHCDPTDCDISYSLSINLSVLRDSTSLGYFWFTDYDCLVPLKPMQICIFQGVEEHTGTPLVTNPDDTSPLPRGYTEETRFNIICYPKKPILNNTAQRNYGKQSNAPSRPNLFRDALYQFGGQENYNTWRARETFRLTVPYLKDRFDYSGDLTIDPAQCYNMIGFSELPDSTPTSSDAPAGPSTTLTQLSRPTAYHMPVQQTLESRDMDDLIDHLGSIIRLNKRFPFRTATQAGEVAKLSGLLEQSGHIPQKRTALHSLEDEEDESTDDDEEPAVYERNIDPESILQQIDIANSGNEAEGPDLSGRVGAVTFAELEQFDLFDEQLIGEELEKSQHWIMPSGSLHRFSMQEHLKQLIPALPPTASTGEGRSSATIVEFSVVYASILGQLNWKHDQAEVVQAGILATFGRLTMEWLEQIENDFSDLFRVGDEALVLHPNSIGYRLKVKIDEYVDSLTGENDPNLLFHFDAEEIIGDAYDEHFHLNVDLKPQPNHTNTARVKARAYRNVVWGMCLFWPLHVFVSMVRGIKPSLQSTVQLPLGSKTNHNFLNMVGRWRFLQVLCKTLSDDQYPAESFLFLFKLYRFAFTFRGRARLSRQVIEEVVTLLQEDDDLLERRNNIRSVAAAYQSRFNLDLLLKNQGNKALESLLSVSSQQNQVAKRTKVGGKARKEGGRQAKRQRTKAGGKKDKKEPKPVPSVRYIFVLTPVQMERYNTFLSTLDPLPADTAPLLALVQCVYNAFELTKLCLNKLSRSSTITANQWANQMRQQRHLGVRRFMQAITVNSQGSDKFCAIRTRSPSFQQMASILNSADGTVVVRNVGEMTTFVRRLMLFRAGFGMPRLIELYANCTTLQGVLAAHRQYTEEQLVSRPSLVHNPLYLSAYGELIIRESTCDNFFSTILEAAPVFGRFLMGYHEAGTKPSFDIVMAKFTSLKIPYMNSNGLMNWLLICDLAEFGACEFPTIDALTTKVQTGGGSGPGMALQIAFAHADRTRIPPTDRAEIRAFLTTFERALQCTIGEEWLALAGRRLNTNDSEHLLCKVTRIAKFLK